LWWDSITLKLYVYYNDGDSSQWVSATNSLTGYTGSLGYTGSIGYTGSQGVFGYTGSIGYSGSNGTNGYTGSIGYAGSAAVGAGGDFNTNLTTTIGYAVTDTLAAAFTAPATAGLQYIVRSVHITNIGSDDATITGNFNGTLYSDISFANSITVATGGAVELFVKPKIMNPSDILQLQASTNNVLQALITYEIQTSTKYFGTGVDITSDETFTDLYTASANGQIESILLINDDTYDEGKVRVAYTDGSNTIIGYLVYDLIIDIQSTIELLETPKYIDNGYKIRLYTSAGNRLEAIIAGKLI